MSGVRNKWRYVTPGAGLSSLHELHSATLPGYSPYGVFETQPSAYCQLFLFILSYIFSWYHIIFILYSYYFNFIKLFVFISHPDTDGPIRFDNIRCDMLIRYDAIRYTMTYDTTLSDYTMQQDTAWYKIKLKR